MPYYLDEDQPLTAAKIARERGLDVTATEEFGRKGTTDESQLEFAAEQGRVLITRNYPDFERLTHRFMEEGRPHAGVLAAPPSIRGDDYAGLVAAIEAFEDRYHGQLPPYAIIYLAPVPR